MAEIKAFRGLRPTPEKVDQVASPPYDVLNSDEARQKVKGAPLSFLHVIKPDIDLDPDIDPHDPTVYAKGGENLRNLINDGIMIQDGNPCYYIYRLKMNDHIQTGLVAAASVEDYVHNRIKKHEYTRPDKEQDRMTHIDSLNAQTGPVFLTYHAVPEVDELIAFGMQQHPTYDFSGDYQVRHTLWVVDDPDLIKKITAAFAAIDALYVADGHHRSAAAVRVRDNRRAANPNHTGQEEYNHFLSVIFPDNQMQILDYNRVVTDLNGMDPDTFLEKTGENFTITPQPGTRYKPDTLHCFGMYLKDTWYRLTPKDGLFDKSDPIESLDVSILQGNLLNPVLGIVDPRRDERINFVGGIRGLEELERLVDSGEYEVAFALFPTTISQLLAVADANKVMPPKSTWFEPKLASGVVVHLLD